MNQNHKWQKVVVHDNHGNEYNGYLCTHCEFLVIAYPPLDREDLYDPDYRIILIRAKDLTLTDVEKYIKKHKVTCSDTDSSMNRNIRLHETLEKLSKKC